MSGLLLGLSVATFLLSVTFFGLVVVQHYQHFATLHSQNLDPSGDFWGIWIFIVTMTSLTLFLALTAVVIHVTRKYKLRTIPYKPFVWLDICITLSTTIACLTFAIYFYITIIPYGQMHFSGAEIVTGVMTIFLSSFSAAVTLIVPNGEYTGYPLPQFNDFPYGDPADSGPVEIKTQL